MTSLRPFIIIIILIIALAGGFFLVWPKFQNYHQLLLKMEQKETELNSKTEYYFAIKDIWGKLEKYEDVLSRVDSAIPKNYSTPALFYYLQQVAGQAGVVLGDLNLGGVSGDKVKEIDVNLRVSGSYSSLQKFIFLLENSARFFKIKSIGLSSASSEKGNSFSFDLAITTYSY